MCLQMAHPSLSGHVQRHWRENVVHLRCMQYHHHTNGYVRLTCFRVRLQLTDCIVWALYPETNQRTLEEMDLLFAAKSPWVWDAERNFARLKEENPGLVSAASRGNSVVDPEAGLKAARAVDAEPVNNEK